MKVDGKTRVCGIIANPVEHSMSPLLQNLYAERTGVNMAYVPFKVQEEDIESALKGAFSLNVLGMNVTVPHKQRVMDYLTETDDTAARIGAVNTLVRQKAGYKGYNTDVPGLLRALNEAGICLRGRSCILLGAGGAAKAAAYLMAKEGAAEIYILNRNLSKAETLADYLNEGFQKKLAKPLALSAYEQIPKGDYVAIQSTSVGMDPDVDEAPIEDPKFYNNISEAFDVIYTPAETKFMKYVKAAGGRAVNGLDMLLYQGVISYELWNPGIIVPEHVIKEARESIKLLLKRKTERKPIVLIGFMGAGKTSIGAVFARSRGIPVLDTDQMIEEKAGMSISEIFKTQGEEHFRRLETQILEELLKKGKEETFLLSTGGGLPLRSENRRLLKQIGTVIYLKAFPETVLKRLKDDRTRPLLQGEHVKERVECLLSEREPLYEEACHLTVRVDGKDILKIASEIEIQLEEHSWR